MVERRQWYNQVSTAIRQFHAHNWAYGDTKPENILIDENRRAWLIDFEGGYTPGWVDPKLKNTVEGDLQGLDRLREFLGLEYEAKDEAQAPI
jgi:serine/threonine protein kinase